LPPILGFVFKLGELSWDVSTSFLERFRPLCIWRSQYFWLGTVFLPHLHFFPSVLLHLCGSVSTIVTWSEPRRLNSAIERNEPKKKGKKEPLLSYILQFHKQETFSASKYVKWTITLIKFTSKFF
jgi:hypothetical protein